MSQSRRHWEERYAERRDQDKAVGTVDSPSAFLASIADSISGRVLDVAAGSGRNAVFLARRRCQVEAIDIAHSGLCIAKSAAAAAGADLRVLQADLESYPLPPSRYDAVLNIRYLQRSLFPALQHTVKPGGLIVVETFLIDQQAFGHPKNPAFLLQRGELATVFEAYDILIHEEGLFDDGRGQAYLGRLLARRPARD